MPRIKLTKSAIDALPTPKSDVVYWDTASPGFGIKVTPKGRKVFVVLYRTGGAGSKLRKYTIGPYGRVTLHQARVAAQRVFAAKLEGRDPAAEKRAAKRRVVADLVEELLETFIAQRLSQNRSGGQIARLLRREIGKTWAGRSIHEISKRDVVEVVTAIEQRGAPVAANKTLKSIKTFLRWCVGRAVLNQSPAEGVPLPAKEVARDRVLDDEELARVILAARQIGGPYGGVVEFLALTGQRREEVARVQREELDLARRVWTLPKTRTKNAKVHVVHLSEQSMAVLKRAEQTGLYVFSLLGTKPFQEFSRAKRRLDQLSGVTGGDFMICAGPAYLGWLGLGSPLMLPIRYLTTSPARSQELRPYISGTSSSPSARKRSNDGGLTSGTSWPMLRMKYAAGYGEPREAS
jgi:integrase